MIVPCENVPPKGGVLVPGTCPDCGHGWIFHRSLALNPGLDSCLACQVARNGERLVELNDAVLANRRPV